TENEEHNKKEQRTDYVMGSFSFRNDLMGAFVFSGDRFADRIDSDLQAALIIAGDKLRLDLVLSDIEGCEIRQRALQTVADLDVHFAVLDEHEQDDAVPFVFLAHFPCV